MYKLKKQTLMIRWIGLMLAAVLCITGIFSRTAYASAGEQAVLEMTVYPQSQGKPAQLRDFALNGELAFCVQKNVETSSGKLYTRIPADPADEEVYQVNAEKILGFSREDQKEIAVASAAYGMVRDTKGSQYVPWDTYISYKGKDYHLSELPDTYWLAVSRYWIWSVTEDIWYNEDTPEDYMEHQMQAIEIVYGSGYGWADAWMERAFLKQVIGVVRDFVANEGYPVLSWYYIPGNKVQYLVQPDMEPLIRRVLPSEGRIDLQKEGYYTGALAGVQGAEYTLFDDASCTQITLDTAGNPVVLTTDAGGYAVSGLITVNSEYRYLKETKAPYGCSLNTAVYPVLLQADLTVRAAENDRNTVTDQEWHGRVRLNKTDSVTGEVLSGAVFALDHWSVQNQCYSELMALTETSAGCYESPELYFTADNQGRFRIRETQAPEGYQTADWTQEFVLNETQQEYSFAAVNTPVTRYEFIKVDADGKTLAGCSFRITDENGNTAAEWTTDETGKHTILEGLVCGHTYQLTETAVPAGYQTAEPVIFTVQAGTHEIKVVNHRQYASAAVEKYVHGAAAEGVEFALYSSEYTEGAERITWNNAAWYLVKEGKTDRNGRIEFSSLYPFAEYMLAEKAGVSGSQLLKEPVMLGTIPLERESLPEGYNGNWQKEGETYYLYDTVCVIRDGEEFELPFTGSSAGLLYKAGCAAVLGFTSLTGMAYIKEKRKGEEHE